MTLSLKAPLPNFELRATNGQIYSAASLTGKRIVIFFYPAANTPGCTTESLDFARLAPEFEALGVTLLGASGDTEKKQCNFAAKVGPQVPLLIDPEASLAEAFGIWQEKKNFGKTYMGIVRSTFLIGEDGTIERIWSPVKVAGHAQEVLDHLRSA